MLTLQPGDLRVVLQTVHTAMQEAKVLSAMDKQSENQLMDDVTEKLTEKDCTIPLESLDHERNPEAAQSMQKSLGLALLSKFVPTFDPTILFKETMNKNEAIHVMENEFHHLLTSLNDKLTPSKQKAKIEIKKMSKSLAEDLSEKYMNKPDLRRLGEDSNCVDAFSELVMANYNEIRQAKLPNAKDWQAGSVKELVTASMNGMIDNKKMEAELQRLQHLNPKVNIRQEVIKEYEAIKKMPRMVPKMTKKLANELPNEASHATEFLKNSGEQLVASADKVMDNFSHMAAGLHGATLPITNKLSHSFSEIGGYLKDKIQETVPHHLPFAPAHGSG